MTTKDYPTIGNNKVNDVLNKITEIRKQDIVEFRNLEQRFIRGRKVNKIPQSSTDVVPGDLVGDFSFSDTNLYILVNSSGNLEWRTASLGTF